MSTVPPASSQPEAKVGMAVVAPRFKGLPNRYTPLVQYTPKPNEVLSFTAAINTHKKQFGDSAAYRFDIKTGKQTVVNVTGSNAPMERRIVRKSENIPVAQRTISAAPPK